MGNSDINISTGKLLKLVDIIRKRSLKTAYILGKNIVKTLRSKPRRIFLQENGFVLSNIMISPSYQCNLACYDCSPNSTNRPSDELPHEITDKIIEENEKKWAAPYISFSGGEVIYYTLEAASRYREKLFHTYTNGTLVTKEIAMELKKLGNIIPLVSLEGTRGHTSNLRIFPDGSSAYDKIMTGIENLNHQGVPFGLSIKLTKSNIYLWQTASYVDSLIRLGAFFVRIPTLMPSGRGGNVNDIPTPEQREIHGRNIRRINESGRPIFILDYINSPSEVIGCAAGGIRYVHIDPAGNITPCVFMHESSGFNLIDVYKGLHLDKGINSLEDVLIKDPFMKKVRETVSLQDPRSPCILIDNPFEYRKIISIKKKLVNPIQQHA